MPTPATTTNEDIGKEGPDEVQDYFTIDKDDSELVEMIDRKIRNAYSDYEKLRTEGRLNERYWAEDQLKGIQLYWHNSRIVQNRIYMGVETMVPIITSKPAEPVISVADLDDEDENEKTRDFIRDVQKLLLDKYYDEDHPQQEVYEMVSRHLLLYKVGIPKIRWDNLIDDYIIEFVHPHKVIISTDGHYNADVWTAEYLEWTLKEILDEFPEKENDIMANVFPGANVVTDEVKGTPIGFWEYWSEDGKFVVWKMQNVILQKKLNPYIKWKDLEEGEEGNSKKEFDTDANHFSYPKKPLMFLNSQNLGRHIWDDTSPVSQGRSLQDGINLMQRIITDTSRDQGILVGAQEHIDRDELFKYTGAYNEKLSVKGSEPKNALYRVPAKSLQAFVQENQIHLETAMDNIMGVHSTTRGERSKAPTLGQDILAKESDYGRIDAIVRGVERVANEIYNWELQMIAVKYEKKHYDRILGEKKGKKVMEQVKENVKKNIKITVKPGSTLPTDKLSQRAETIELAKANKIADVDFFERMDFPNAKEMAKNLFLQENAPEKLYPELVKEMEADLKKKAKAEGRLNEDGTIQPEVSVAAGQIPPPPMPQVLAGAVPGQVPPPVEAIPGQAPPVAPEVMPPPPAAPVPQVAAPQPVGTEHTEALLQGTLVQPFEGIQPSPEHVSQELQFMGSDEFTQLPEPIQALYAKHVLAEREIIQNAQSPRATA